MTILLMDNGSVEPAAVLALRQLAAGLGQKLGRRVEPISLLHSSAVPAAQLGHQAAEIFEPALEHRLKAGQSEFLVVPAFIGPSAALTDYLPRRVTALREKFPQLRLRLAPCLVNARDSSDQRIAEILSERVRDAAPNLGGGPSPRNETAPRVVLVDHGSPVRAVAAVRDHVAAQLRIRLGLTTEMLVAASMERRAGPDYAFADPLLQNVLDQTEFTTGTVVIALLFLSPGRHAGPNGDVARICASATQRHPTLRTLITAPIGSHPALVDILAERTQEGLAGPCL